MASRGITRREAIAGGALTLGAFALRGPSALAASTTPVSWPHTATRATTSLTAFIGPFSRGPIDQAILVTSWDEFASIFGGLDPTDSAGSSFAVLGVFQFFQNAGSTVTGAWIVRLDAPGSAAAQATSGPLTVRANDPGAWGNGLRIGLRPSTRTAGAVIATVTGPSGDVLETLTDLAPNGSTAELAAAINQNSQLIDVTAEGDGPPLMATAALAGGSDGTWAPASLASAVLAQLGEPDGPSPAEPMLDQLAPQVFNLLCIPDLALLSTAVQTTVIEAGQRFCKARQAFQIVDPSPPAAALKSAWLPGADATPIDAVGTSTGMAALQAWATGILSPEHEAAATYYPWVSMADPFDDGAPRLVPPSGTVAGVYAATDATRGVWKAPAGTRANLSNVVGLADAIDDTINGMLNAQGLNCLRAFPTYGNVVWGARTLAGADLLNSPYKYLSVRRLADFVEQTLDQSLKWAVFEPNDAKLWASITLEATEFMSGLYGAGAFAGVTAAAAYTVACDATTTSPADIAAGNVNVAVAFAAVDPAEFVVLDIRIAAGPAAA